MAEGNGSSGKYKVVFVGDAGVGKTSIINAQFGIADELKPTIGATMATTSIETHGSIVNLTVWDTAGHDTYRSLVPIYVRGAQLAVLVFDRTNETSFQHLDDWLSYIHKETSDVLCLVVANKSDLVETFSYEKVVEWATEKRLPLHETTVKNKASVNDLFVWIANTLYENGHIKVETPTLIPRDPSTESEERICC